LGVPSATTRTASSPRPTSHAIAPAATSAEGSPRASHAARVSRKRGVDVGSERTSQTRHPVVIPWVSSSRPSGLKTGDHAFPARHLSVPLAVSYSRHTSPTRTTTSRPSGVRATSLTGVYSSGRSDRTGMRTRSRPSTVSNTLRKTPPEIPSRSSGGRLPSSTDVLGDADPLAVGADVPRPE
jgi:hypothetical protein